MGEKHAEGPHDVTKEHWANVSKVAPLPGHLLALAFEDGKVGVYDMTENLGFNCYAPLRDDGFFRRATVDGGTVVWPDDIDIAPEELYFNSVRPGTVKVPDGDFDALVGALENEAEPGD